MNELLNYLIALPLAFLANVALGGVEIGRLKEQFNNGIMRG